MKEFSVFDSSVSFCTVSVASSVFYLAFLFELVFHVSLRAKSIKCRWICSFPPVRTFSRKIPSVIAAGFDAGRVKPGKPNPSRVSEMNNGRPL